MSIDNLPAEMPLEASEYFSHSLFPHIVQLTKGNLSHPVLKRATIAEEGKLLGKHEKLHESIKKHAPDSIKVEARTKKVLLLGSGYVAGPLVDYLVRDKNHLVTVGNIFQVDC
jgi:alpha-aminoadipic semialdehyde synthase